MPRNNHAFVLAGIAAVFGAGYYLAPRELLDNEVASRGFFSNETRRVLSAAVLSLRADGRLRVYQYAGEATVEVRQRWLLGLVEGQQQLSVPANITYYLDLGAVTAADVAYDEASAVVTVRLPRLELGDVAVQPEQARVTNSGTLTYSDDVVQELARANYLTARRAFVKQAQQPTLVASAKASAARQVEAYFLLPLRAIGRTDVRVRAYFP